MERRGPWEVLKYSNLISWGLTTAGLLLIGAFGGSWLDRRWGTSPLFLVTATVLAIVTSLKTLITELLAMQRAAAGTGRPGSRDPKGGSGGPGDSAGPGDCERPNRNGPEPPARP